METKRIKISDTKNINDEELKEAAQIDVYKRQHQRFLAGCQVRLDRS